VCASIEACQDAEAVLSIGNHLKHLFIENPLLNFYLIGLLK
jgi:hypothetical protein